MFNETIQEPIPAVMGGFRYILQEMAAQERLVHMPVINQSLYLLPVSIDELVIETTINIRIPSDPVPMPLSSIHPQSIDPSQAAQVKAAQRRAVTDDD